MQSDPQLGSAVIFHEKISDPYSNVGFFYYHQYATRGLRNSGQNDSLDC
jgi:hypothetical protein